MEKRVDTIKDTVVVIKDKEVTIKDYARAIKRQTFSKPPQKK